MLKIIKLYILLAEKIGYFFGRIAMYLIFLMIAVLLFSSISKTFFVPQMWTLEFAQFLMVSYFLLGGAYSLQLDSHVRMDLMYGGWSTRTKLWVDAFTMLCLITYLVTLLYGSIDSLSYALEYGERSYSSWRPYMWPIKTIMTFGILMMLLQVIALFFKDVLALMRKSV